MPITGILVGIFLVVHIIDFRVQVDDPTDLAGMVRERLSQTLGALIYIGGVIALGIHLSHGFASASRYRCTIASLTSFGAQSGR